MTSLYDFLTTTGGDYDVYDSECDAPGVAWCLPDPDDNDHDAQVFRSMAKQIEFVRAVSSCECICKLSDYVKQNLSLLYSICKDSRYEMSGDPNQIDEDVYVGILTINGLAVGGYPDSTYDDFLKMETLI